MTSPKTFKRYASQWLARFDDFKDHPDKVFVTQAPDMKKAKALRLEFYKAREAFLNDPSMCQEYEATLNSREVQITDDFKVVFELKDNNWVGKLLDSMIGQEEQDEVGKIRP